MKIPRSVLIGLILAIALDTFIQIFWKLAVVKIPANASPVGILNGAFHSPAFYIAMTAFLAQLFNWLRVLARADLSFAQPITALSYVSVLVFSVFSLHETLSLSRLSGVAMIFIGVFFISRTPHVSSQPTPSRR